MDSTELLRRVAEGDESAKEELFRSCYEDLRARAHRMMSGGTPQTLQPTVLVHEAWMKLALPDTAWEDRGHFLNVATRAMRCVLVDYARARLTEKRGGGGRRQDLDGLESTEQEPSWRILALDEALETLAIEAPKLHRVAELRIFAGLAHKEIASIMGVTERTVERHWHDARSSFESFL